MTRKLIAVLAASAGLAFSTPAAAQGACDRELLEGIGESWIAALEQGTMMTMALGEWVDYNQNFEKTSLGGFLDFPREVEWSMALLDTGSCQVYVGAIVNSEEGGRQILATHIGNGFFGTGPFQNIVTGEDDWLFDAASALDHAGREEFEIVPESERVSRQELLSAADAYLDRFNDPAVVVPWAATCARLEGGAYTEDCSLGMPDEAGVIEIVDRVYVVDEARQAVNVLSKFGPDQLPDSHTFRMEDGRIGYVHAATHCKGLENCGFPALEEM